jgi:hypothetical protein
MPHIMVSRTIHGLVSVLARHFAIIFRLSLQSRRLLSPYFPSPAATLLPFELLFTPYYACYVEFAVQWSTLSE